MYKIGVIGSSDTVLGFRALGLNTFAADTEDEARRTLREITAEGGGYAIIYIEEHLHTALAKDIAEFADKITPAIIAVPGRGGSTGKSLRSLEDAVLRAVGSNIF
ncbi:MAG: V-type ATP synthase subunit F [Oscillospiraceae bacterium]|jgi:V/A-type H+-transporting ATPase subunit F|nr:V-type ATP synthase subunit F [Oscillospiraceae bacterium]